MKRMITAQLRFLDFRNQQLELSDSITIKKKKKKAF